MVTRLFVLVCLATTAAKVVQAQGGTCSFKPPFYTLHFGKGKVQDVNLRSLALYDRVSSSCPTDGHYSYVPATSDCFRGDWHTLTEDFTPGDVGGNMLLVNSAPEGGVFLSARVKGFKSETTYQFGVWLMNVCKPTRKCPFPLLPNLTILIRTAAGRTVARFATGNLSRTEAPKWIQHRAQFTVPASVTELELTIVNNAPGGCGNDLALDDLTFRECIKQDPVRSVKVADPPKKEVKKQLPVVKKENKKPASTHVPVKKEKQPVILARREPGKPGNEKPLFVSQPVAAVPVPLVLKQRTNSLVREIKTEEGEVTLELYDNGEIDGDTVSIYHNNTLVAAQQRLSQKPIWLKIRVDKMQPRHELVMVANNLGSIPPNTSLMIVTANGKRYQVYISSTEQTNARVVIALNE